MEPDRGSASRACEDRRPDHRGQPCFYQRGSLGASPPVLADTVTEDLLPTRLGRPATEPLMNVLVLAVTLAQMHRINAGVERKEAERKLLISFCKLSAVLFSYDDPLLIAGDVA